MHVTVLLLLGAVTSDGSSDATNCTLGAILETLAEILQLALSLLLLAGLVLLNTCLAQALDAGQVASGFLDGANGLVPRASVTLGVVLCDSAGVGVSGDGTQLGGGVGVGVLGLGLFLGDFTLGL